MAKEKFLIIATPMADDCFSRFSETANREAIDEGYANPEDAYSWIEKSFEIQLIRWREATHICSFTPSAYFVWLQNYFVGAPNESWERGGDPDGLENESGGEFHGYAEYRDDYDARFVCAEFTIDTMRDLPEPMRKPRKKRHAMTTGDHGDAAERYHAAIWERAEESAHEMAHNGGITGAPILDVWMFRQWEREQAEKTRKRACEWSNAARHYSWPNDLLAPAYAAQWAE
jgi:hypothetical protein